VTRLPYEEPYHTQIRIVASNGAYSGTLDLYCGVDELLAIGDALNRFPAKVPDDYSYEYGSEDPAKRAYRHVRLRAYTTDLAGHCALQFEMNLNASEPDEGSCRFSIQIEPGSINRLGQLFRALHRAPMGEFEWTPEAGDFREVAREHAV